MGGEPTFVSVDEWTAPSGIPPPSARPSAATRKLVRRLRDRFAPGGLLHYGQGKWYPGEPLPRWAFAVYWRADGEPLWQNELIDDEVSAKAPTIADADRFTKALSSKLGLPQDSAIPAYEDPAYFVLVEQKLPINATRGTNKLDDPAERARIVRIFERGLAEPASYVLPVQVWQSPDRGRRWVTERWAFRREKLFLMPGDSPAGFRLPIGGLP